MASITGTVTDYDGNVYNIVRIGDQEWLESNLKATHYADGTVIPDVVEGNPTGTYGKLYQWDVVASKEIIAGWHLPTNAEWAALADTLGGKEVAGGKMKSTAGWNSPNTGATNESGLNILPGGHYRTTNSSYLNEGVSGYCLSAESYGFWQLLYNNANLLGPYTTDRTGMFSVRLVRQAPIPTIEVPDILISKGGRLHSLRGQTIWKDGAGHTFNAGCGVVKNGILYALKEAVPYLQDFTPDPADPIGTEVMLTDKRDNEKYRCIKAADGRWWMGENLKYETATGSYVHDNNPANLVIYGRLYEWQAAMNAAPERWSLPSDNEWKQLEMALGMSSSDANNTSWRGTDQGTQLKEGGISKVELLLGGYWGGGYENLGSEGDYWSSTENGSNAWCRNVTSSQAGVYRDGNNKTDRFSVRYILNT